ncbi:MAG TPA: LapA family protein [Roseiarcus sp.]|nr:LapA family protein [Roseiarcus sp.]
MEHFWLEANPELSLALAALFFAICWIAVGWISKTGLRSQIRKLNGEVSRLESELADARVMALRRLAERLAGEKPPPERPFELEASGEDDRRQAG